MNNFTLSETRFIEYVGGDCSVYAHKTGARAVAVRNSDKIGVFSLSFETPALDDSGLPHVLEHCVLSGSEKYAAIDPCLELESNSLFTYLNAYTSDDHTVYLAGSYDRESFYNIYDVYLDGVFRPNLTKEVFFRERRIVHNEMSSRYSDIAENIHNKIRHIVYENSNFRFNSAGVPDEILQISHKQLLEYYDKFYKPSNLTAFFYGDIDADECLSKLDGYLCRPKAQGLHSFAKIPAPPRRDGVLRETYDCGDDNEKGKNFVVLVYCVDKCDYMKYLSSFLSGSISSPLHEKLVVGGICDTVQSFCADSFGLYPYFYIFIQNSTIATEELSQLVDGVLREIVEKGFNSEYFSANINAAKLFCAEKDFGYRTLGIECASVCVNDLPKGKDIFRSMDFRADYVEIEKNPHVLAKCAGKLVNCGNKFVVEFLPRPKKTVFAPKIPKINLSNIVDNTKNTHFNTNGKILATAIDTDGIVYANIRFDLSFVEKSLTPFVSLLTHCLARIGTLRHAPVELSKKIGILGTYDAACEVRSSAADGACLPSCVIKLKFFDNNCAAMFDVIREIVTETTFNDKKLLRRIVTEYFAAIEDGYDKRQFAILAAAKDLSLSRRFTDDLNGVSFYRFLRNIASENSETSIDILSEKLTLFANDIFNQNGLSVEIAAPSAILPNLSLCASTFISAIPRTNILRDNINKSVFVPKFAKNAIEISTNSAYCALAASAPDFPHIDPGLCAAVSHILTNEYIIPELRLKSGAYIAWAEISERGGVVSLLGGMFRGSDVRNAYEIFSRVPEFLRRYAENIDGDALEHAIIGALNVSDKPRKPAELFASAVEKHICRLEPDYETRFRQGILSLNAEKIIFMSDILAAVMKNISFSALLGTKAIMTDKNFFDGIEKL